MPAGEGSCEQPPVRSKLQDLVDIKLRENEKPPRRLTSALNRPAAHLARAREALEHSSRASDAIGRATEASNHGKGKPRSKLASALNPPREGATDVEGPATEASRDGSGQSRRSSTLASNPSTGNSAMLALNPSANDSSRRDSGDGEDPGRTADVQWLSSQMQGATAKRIATMQDERNQKRVRRMDDDDRETLSKYLPESLDELFVGCLEGPDDFFEPPEWLSEAIRDLNKETMEVPKHPPFKFEMTAEAAAHNLDILAKADFNLDRVIRENPDTTIAYGKEFRPVEKLERIYSRHPNFKFVKTMLENGMDFTFEYELTEEERVADLQAALDYGNHKSAEANMEEILRLLHKDVLHGFALPVPTASLPDLPGAVVQPAGMVEQMTLNELGGRVPKKRLTHDDSFNFTDVARSINDRVDMSAYPELIYGYCLSRIIHYVVALRLAFPDKSILIAKFDYSDAYRRIHHSGRSALMQILALGQISLVMLRMAFGGSPNPAAWTGVSEMVTDLSNELFVDKHWNHEEVFPPFRAVAPEPIRNGEGERPAPAREMAFKIPTTVKSRTDDFIDDLMSALMSQRS